MPAACRNVVDPRTAVKLCAVGRPPPRPRTAQRAFSWPHRLTAVLSLAILPFQLVFWYGFALPYGPVLGVARTVFLLAAWPALKPRGSL